MAEQRYMIAQKETEMLLCLRELMSADIYAPNSYFDGDRILKQSEGFGKAGYDIPFKTFWIPIELGEKQMDPDSKEAEKYKINLDPDAYLKSQLRGVFQNKNFVKEYY